MCHSNAKRKKSSAQCLVDEQISDFQDFLLTQIVRSDSVRVIACKDVTKNSSCKDSVHHLSFIRGEPEKDMQTASTFVFLRCIYVPNRHQFFSIYLLASILYDRFSLDLAEARINYPDRYSLIV